MTSILTLPQHSHSSGCKLSRKHRKFLQKQETESRVALIDNIKHTQGLLKEAYHCFQLTTDPDMIESYIYEINALQARHNYLSKQLR